MKLKSNFLSVFFHLILVFVFSCNSSLNKEYDEEFVSVFQFNNDWKFIKLEDQEENNEMIPIGVDFSDEPWETVTLPHTANLEPYVTLKQWQGICWYRKTMHISKDQLDKTYRLKLDGAMNVADVWINNTHVTQHLGGYLPVVVDMSQYLTEGKNVISIKLDNEDNPITGPKPLNILDFNTYSGLYRNAWLIVKDKLHITDPILENKPASGGIFVTYPKISKDEALVSIKVHIRNEYDVDKKFTVLSELYKEDKLIVRAVSTEEHLNSLQDKEVTLKMSVLTPELWSPIKPQTYNLVTSIIAESGKIIDKESHAIGFRNIEFKGQKLYVNGEPIFLRGVNRHQDYPYLGYAISDNSQWRDAVKIKEAGFDYVRLSHYPHAPSFMEACNSLGLFVLDAIPGWQYFNEDPKFADQVEQTVRDMIRRDRNNPCVLAWEASLNETQMPKAFIDRLIKVVQEEYPTGKSLSAGWMEYGYDIFLQARQHRHDNTIETKKPYNVSEYGDWEYYAQNAGLNQDSWNDLKESERTSRQLLEFGEKALLQQATNIQEAHNDNLYTPAHADGYWVMFDYNRGYHDDLEASGIMSIDRLPKFSYDFYRSQRAIEEKASPMVSIASYWTPDSSLDVRVFSNCDEVALLLNGEQISKQRPDTNRISTNLKNPPFTFKVEKFQAGTLVAVGYIKGEAVVRDALITPNDFKNMTIEFDESGIKASANDDIFVRAVVRDENGTQLPYEDGQVLFTIDSGTDGMLIGDNPATIKAGISSILLKTGSDKTDYKITAQYKNVEAQGTLSVQP
ncbi:beta-galactosidase [Flaviramulus basaltis]|uniref:Beta-galactosidase n=1 Tax=Flaviramulus basaltis TaxID=369401 RepID=A0A1K2IAL9_9FLAO|nr:glycoside hydrolase family 2 TIM barrel-domain containing protein [Flaviramulus basaltis]SFZ89447.1 beta-galactosidase [Flaviramulus basaltis]